MDNSKSFLNEQQPEMTGFRLVKRRIEERVDMALDHTEINFSASVDDKFYGSLTYAHRRRRRRDRN